MKKILLIAAVAGLVFTGTNAEAQRMQRDNGRMDNRGQIIHQGDRRMVAGPARGSLTAMEMKRVNVMKRQLQRDIRMANADGVVTYRERMIIERQRKAIDRMMFRDRFTMHRR